MQRSQAPGLKPETRVLPCISQETTNVMSNSPKFQSNTSYWWDLLYVLGGVEEENKCGLAFAGKNSRLLPTSEKTALSTPRRQDPGLSSAQLLAALSLAPSQ